jgi:hypothetical protein
MTRTRRFPTPWSVDDIGGCFVVKASNNRPLVFIYYGEGRSSGSILEQSILGRWDAQRRSLIAPGKVPAMHGGELHQEEGAAS